MKKSISILLTIILALGIVLSGCSGGSEETGNESNKEGFKSEITFSGSSTLAPVMAAISTDFIEENETWDKVNADFPEENITIYVSAGGSGAGAKSVIDGIADFGMLSRNLKDEEKEQITDLKEYKLGMDALTISVNPKNPLAELKDSLTKEEIVKIFSGEYKQWSDLDPSLPARDIVVVTRDLSGGAHEVFQKNIMGDVEVKGDAIQSPSMGALVTKIIENEDAIGYASFGVVNQNEGQLSPMKVDGVEATEDNILSGKYIVSRPLIVVRSGEPTESEQAFLDVLTSEEGKEKIREMGFIPEK